MPDAPECATPGDCAHAGQLLGLEVLPQHYPAQCCDSCHDDVDYGYPLADVEFRGQEYVVCCRISELLDAATPEATT